MGARGTVGGKGDTRRAVVFSVTAGRVVARGFSRGKHFSGRFENAPGDEMSSRRRASRTKVSCYDGAASCLERPPVVSPVRSREISGFRPRRKVFPSLHSARDYKINVYRSEA